MLFMRTARFIIAVRVIYFSTVNEYDSYFGDKQWLVESNHWLAEAFELRRIIYKEYILANNLYIVLES